MKNKILVIGGTGTVGSAVVEELKQGKADFVVLTRKQEKADTLIAKGISAVVGTLGEWSTIEPILEDIDSLYLVTSPAADLLDLHKGLIDLAVKSGVKKIVRSSAEPANYSEGMYMYEQHTEADAYLKQSGLEYVILQPHYFMQNMFFVADYIKSQNSFAQYLGEAKIPMIDVRDIAKAAFQALTKNDFNNQTFVLTGPQSISLADVANALSKSLGREIQYFSMSYEDQEAGYKMFGMPDWQLQSVMQVFKHWADGKSIGTTNDLERMTGLQATSIETFVADHAHFFK